MLAPAGRTTHAAAVRSIGEQAAVRLYRLDPEGGVETLFYGPLAEALAEAAALPEGRQAEIYVQTENDVVALHDLLGG